MRRRIFLIILIFIIIVFISIGAIYTKKDDRSDDGYTFNTKDIAPDIQGVGGPIEMLVRLDKNGNIVDVKILSHNETPEYAKGITEPSFLNQFKGKNADDDFIIGKDVDAVTGATISSKAVIDTLKTSLQRYKNMTGPKPETSSGILKRLERFGLTPKEARYYEVIE